MLTYCVLLKYVFRYLNMEYFCTVPDFFLLDSHMHLYADCIKLIISEICMYLNMYTCTYMFTHCTPVS